MTAKLSIIALLVLACACVTENEDGPEEDTTVEQGVSLANTSPNCAWGGGIWWCQDIYTGKWCTSSYAANGWDHAPTA